MQVFADDGERNGGIEREKVAGTATAAATTTIASTTSVPPPTTSTQPQQLPPPPRITFRPLDASTLPELKALNAALFPVNYGPRVYEQALAAGGISHGAFFRAGDGMEEELVGAITVRLESGGGGGAGASLFVSSEEGGGGGNGGDKDPPPPPPPPADDGLAKMYVMTVGVLSAWRGQGIGECDVFLFSFAEKSLLFVVVFFFTLFSSSSSFSSS